MPCHIPAMTVQPLVENAIHHAAEHMLDTCIIRISGNVVPDGIDVIVQDNGPGIDEDILTKLRGPARGAWYRAAQHPQACTAHLWQRVRPAHPLRGRLHTDHHPSAGYKAGET